MTLLTNVDPETLPTLLRLPKPVTGLQLSGTRLLTAETRSEEAAFVFTKPKSRM